MKHEMKYLHTFENFLNEYGPLAGSGNVDQLERIKRDAMKKSERGNTVYVVGGKNETYKISKYYEKGNTYAAYHNGMQMDVDESKVNEAKTSLDDMMKWIEKSMKFVKTSKEFDGNVAAIRVSGENGDRYKGKQIYDYYVQDPKNYELGVLKDWEKELNKRGWYSEWYDAGTVMIWPD